MANDWRSICISNTTQESSFPGNLRALRGVGVSAQNQSPLRDPRGIRRDQVDSYRQGTANLRSSSILWQMVVVKGREGGGELEAHVPRHIHGMANGTGIISATMVTGSYLGRGPRGG